LFVFSLIKQHMQRRIQLQCLRRSSDMWLAFWLHMECFTLYRHFQASIIISFFFFFVHLFFLLCTCKNCYCL
jgi:hypothetical protein